MFDNFNCKQYKKKTMWPRVYHSNLELASTFIGLTGAVQLKSVIHIQFNVLQWSVSDFCHYFGECEAYTFFFWQI